MKTCDGLVLSTTVANEMTNIWFKLNQRAYSSLEVSEKKVYESYCKKNNSQQAEEANIVRSDIAKVTGHRSMNFLSDYDEEDEE